MDRECAEEFGLNPPVRFDQDAVPGSDEWGCSQALLGIEVRALPTEKAVIDYEPRSAQSVAGSLPSNIRQQSDDTETAADD